MKEPLFLKVPLVLVLLVLLDGWSASIMPNIATAATTTSTPIKHIVIIFQENVSFDHYFGTYPHAMNGSNESKFTPAIHTPSVNGLSSTALQTSNPNSANPFRLNPSQQRTCDITHSYTGEQKQYHGGLMDKFVQFSDPLFSFNPKESGKCNQNQVMGYYDGNTVSALWNYAQHFAMSDNFYGSTFGPSVPGHINLISGQTHGALPSNTKGVINGTVIGNPDPVPR